MNLFKKIATSLLVFSIFAFILAPPVFAQSVLDDIKARLESEGIAVIDYSSQEGQWGSLPDEWIAWLSKNYTSLSDFADQELEDYFIGDGSLTDLRRQLAIMEAEKSRLTDTDELIAKENDIVFAKTAIKYTEEEAKETITGFLSGVSTVEEKEEGIKLIFNEVDFYYNYNKWGSLPQRIIGILEGEEYLSLQDLVDVEGIENIETALVAVVGLSVDDISLISDSVAILSATGERQLNEITRAVANTIKNLIAGLAVMWIVYAGARMIFAQGDESVITEQKKAILYAGVGLVSILLVGRGIDYLYGPAGIVRTELVRDQGFTNEVYGVVNFIKALVGTVAILFIVISGVRTLFATGQEDELTKQKTSILWIAVGLIMIAVDKIIIENFFIIPTQEQSDQIRTSNITSVINVIGSVIQFILGFVGLIAFGALIYGAATMIMNFGNDEMVEKAKKIIKNAIIGILVILSAYVIVSTLVVFK